MKTIKQIADELGIGKQRVYRYIKANRISEAHHEHDMKYYDEAAETQIIQHFSGLGVSGEAHHEAHQTASSDTVIEAVVAMLKDELQIKNKQIEDLTAALEHTTASLHAAQALHAGTMQKQLSDGRADQNDQQEQQGFFSRFFKKKTP